MGEGNESDPGTAPEERRLWQVKLAIVATPEEHEELLDRLTDVLCPDPHHEGPCDIPWAMHSVNGNSLPAKERKALLNEIADTNPS
ncbi:hypothetical protein [Streptomyces sp. NPDC054787]